MRCLPGGPYFFRESGQKGIDTLANFHYDFRVSFGEIVALVGIESQVVKLSPGSMGLAGPNRQAVVEWSYGGFMT